MIKVTSDLEGTAQLDWQETSRVRKRPDDETVDIMDVDSSDISRKAINVEVDKDSACCGCECSMRINYRPLCTVSRGHSKSSKRIHKPHTENTSANDNSTNTLSDCRDHKHITDDRSSSLYNATLQSNRSLKWV